MNYLILDDEPLALEDLEAALRQAAPGGILHGFSLPSEAMKFVEHTPVDVAFLDIELGSASGLSFAKQLKDRTSSLSRAMNSMQSARFRFMQRAICSSRPAQNRSAGS